MAIRHELPTHLAVEDRVLAGLSMRQLLLLLCGACGAYALWQQLAWLPLGPRLALVTLDLTWGLVFALWRPAGRSLDAWGLVVVRFLLIPRVAVWRPVAPDRATPPRAERWADFAPPAVWPGQLASGGGTGR